MDRASQYIGAAEAAATPASIWLARTDQDLPAARYGLEKADRIFETMGDLRWQASAWIGLGEVALAEKDLVQARVWAEKASTALEAIGDEIVVGMAGSLLSRIPTISD